MRLNGLHDVIVDCNLGAEEGMGIPSHMMELKMIITMCIENEQCYVSNKMI